MLRKIFLQSCCWLLCMFFLFPFGIKAQQPLRFSHFTVENGLSSPSTLCITQDDKGFLWIGTMDGLNRYDGKRVKTYRDFSGKNLVDRNVQVTHILADKENHLWFGTNTGLFIYDIKADSFIKLCANESDSNDICFVQTLALFMDKQGEIWVGTNVGLSKVVKSEKGFQLQSVIPGTANKTNNETNCPVRTMYETKKGLLLAGTEDGIIVLPNSKNNAGKIVCSSSLLKGQNISSIVEDKQQCIWVGTRAGGLFKLDSNFNILKNYQQQENTKTGGLLSNIIRKIYRDKNGRMWVGTLKGLNIVDPETGQIDSYQHKPSDGSSLNFNSIYDIFEDMQGSIWLATYFGGLNCVNAISTPFKIYQNEERESGLSSNIISAMVEDEHNNLWIGTEAEGLNYFDRKNNLFRRYNNGNTSATLSSNLVKTLLKDHNNHIWVGMYGGGVNAIDAAGKKLTVFGTNEPQAYRINSQNVTALMQDRKKRIWIGTEYSGINIYDFQTNKTEKFETVFPNAKLSDKTINFLYQDKSGHIWIGTWNGLYMLQPDTGVLTSFLKADGPNHLKSNYITCIAEDVNNKIWIGTIAGLTSYDPSEKTMQNYTVQDGLAGNKVLGIIADEQNNLWISTNNGLNRLSADRSNFYKFDVNDGLPGNVFNTNSFYKDKVGHLFFGGYNGLVEFVPGEINMNKRIPDVVLTGLTVNEHAIHAGDSSGILQQDITETHELELRHDQNVLSLEFAVMNFIKPAKNTSAYILEGYNKDWIYSDEQKITFTNLPTGTYLLKIKAANNDGIWNDSPYTIKIKVLPPPWKSWWAYSLYTLFIVLLAAGIIYFFASRTAMRRKLHYEHMLNVKQQELHQMKMDFFTHISHELRTPLTLIIGPVEMLKQSVGTNPSANKLLDNIMNNAERLLKLTNDLLEFRKADAGYTQLKVRSVQLNAFVQSIFDNFATAAAKKSIDYRLENIEPELTVYFDPNLMEIVLSNLLSNALKFTPEAGVVLVKVYKNEDDTFEITVIDNGVGIPEESQDKIFSNFYQADAGVAKKTGSGIGLAFSKSLVELHKGNLSFNSGINPDTGKMKTSFTITLSLGKNHFNDAALIAD